MSKKYQKLCQLWQNDAFYKGSFPDWLDQRRDERKARKKKPVHDYTPHPWSETVPCSGKYLIFIEECGWEKEIIEKELMHKISWATHWMPLPPVPTEATQ
jgi:hypothetical protein